MTFINKLDNNQFRAKIVIFTIIIAFTILNMKIFHVFHEGILIKMANKINFADEKKNKKNIKNNKSINPFTRLDIIDRNGTIVAKNIMVYDFYLKPNKIINIKENIDKIINIFPELADKKNHFINLLESKKDSNSNIIIKHKIDTLKKNELLNNGVLGLYFEESEKRFYPYANIASHLIGFLSLEGNGVLGIERSMNSYLKTIENQEPLQLSIDINIQNILHDIISKKMLELNANGAVAIVMKVKTGEIISAVSLPDFDPNNAGLYTYNNIFNRFSLGVYELGSVFKILLVSLAIDNDISINKMYDRREYVVGDYIIHDIDKKDKIGGQLSLIDIIRLSSNVGCARIIEDIGFEKQKILFNKLGFFDKLEYTEIGELGKPIYPKRWSKTNSVTMSYGHGIAITPLHFVSSISSILNDGKLIYPRLLKNNNDYKVNYQIVSKNTSEIVRNILQQVIDTGAGKKAAVKRYNLGGKSGTAIKQVNGKYDKFKMTLSFVAALPINDPEYVFFIMFDEPEVNVKNNFFMRSSNVVGPVISNVISIIGPSLGIKPNIENKIEN